MSTPAPGQPAADPSTAARPHAWQRHHRLWEVYYTAAAVFTGHQIWVSGPPAGPHRALALILLAALALWYVALGRRLILDDRPIMPARLVFLAGILVLLAAATALVPASSVALFALIPQAHQVLPTRGLLPTGGIMLLVLAAALVPAAVRTGIVGDTLLIAAVVLVLAVPNTVWITRVVGQSADRADLIDQLRASQAEVSRLSHLAGVATERQRLAGDLHDTLAQSLTSVLMLVQSADAALDREPEQARRELALAARTARENLAEVRAVVAALTPAALDGSPLPAALDRLAQRTTTPTTVSVAGEPRPLPTPVEVTLLRAAQESLTNVDKHAAAAQATVSVDYQPDQVTLQVVDDGRGFPSDRATAGYGLPAMQARAAQVAATVTVDSTPGAGTTVRITAPDPPPADTGQPPAGTVPP